MENIDVKISEKVAEEASKQMNVLKRELESNKNAHISLLEDILCDSKEQRKFLKSMSISLLIIVFLVIFGSFGLSMYNQLLLKNMSTENTEKIFDFISNTEFNSSVEMKTDNNSSAENITISN